MRLGIVPPVVHRNPRFDPPPWEAEAGIEEIVAVAQAAERLGYDFICFPGHVAIPQEAEPVRGAVYWDQVATMSYVAAHTQRIRLCAYIVVLGYWHPLQICKTFGTIDRLSNGRLILGVGVGSLEPEFAVLDKPFGDRGARADDALRAIRVSFAQRTPVYHGTHYDYEGFVVDPHGAQERVPMWVGGRTARSLRRAVDLADGWAPFRLEPADLQGMLAAVDLPAGFELVFPPDPPLDPIGDPDGARRAVERHLAAGATALNLRFRHDSLTHYTEQLQAMAELTAEA